jgi:multicomponent Na+:H+ antiporter subunit B
MIQAVPTSPLISTLLLDVGLLSLLVIVAFAIVRMRSLFAVVMLQGVYSLVAAAWFVTLDAVDVAFTEAAVGAGISTVLMLAAMLLADRQSSSTPLRRQYGPLAVVIIAGLALLYAVPDLPSYGDVDSPANSYVGNDYLARTAVEVDIPNVVTAVLASYRGYDTFGEAVVIFAAGLGVLLLLGLDGTSGRYRAKVMGRRLSGPSAPSGVGDDDAVAAPSSNRTAKVNVDVGRPPSVTRYEEEPS